MKINFGVKIQINSLRCVSGGARKIKKLFWWRNLLSHNGAPSSIILPRIYFLCLPTWVLKIHLHIHIMDSICRGEIGTRGEGTRRRPHTAHTTNLPPFPWHFPISNQIAFQKRQVWMSKTILHEIHIIDTSCKLWCTHVLQFTYKLPKGHHVYLKLVK